MRAFRVEHHEYRHGPWHWEDRSLKPRTFAYNTAMARVSERCFVLPNPHDDIVVEKSGTGESYSIDALLYDRKWKCAFPSASLVWRFFEYDWVVMMDYGFRLVEYEIFDNYVLKEHQVVFDAQRARKIRVLSVFDFDFEVLKEMENESQISA